MSTTDLVRRLSDCHKDGVTALRWVDGDTLVDGRCGHSGDVFGCLRRLEVETDSFDYGRYNLVNSCHFCATRIDS